MVRPRPGASWHGSSLPLAAATTLQWARLQWDRSAVAGRRATPGRSLERDVDLDHQVVFRRRDRVLHVLLDEHILWFELLLVEIIGDQLIGRVHVVIGAAMDELERFARWRLADRDPAVRRHGGRLRHRYCGLKMEAGVVRLGVDDHRRTAGLETQLGHGAVDGLEAVDDG